MSPRVPGLLCLAVACAAPALDTAAPPSSGSPAATAALFADAPTLALVDNPDTPLVAGLTAETLVPTTLSWTLVSDLHTAAHGTSELATTHEVAVLDLRAGVENRLTLVATDAKGAQQTWTEALAVTAPSLPDDFPPLDVAVREPARMAPGLTLFNLPSEQPGIANYVAVVDDQGHVAWAHRSEDPVRAVTVLPEGRLVMLVGRERLRFLAFSGEVEQEWTAAGSGTEPGDAEVDALTFHHEMIALDQGHLAVLSAEIRTVDGYPVHEEANPPVAPQEVVGDVLLELDPTGAVVNRWPLLDLLDPTRVGRDSVSSQWWASYLGGDQRDWSHGNSIDWDPATDDLLISLRHQDALLRLHRPTGALRWILAPQANWATPWSDSLLLPAAPTDTPPYHSHGAEFFDGGVVVFDNHNHGASAGEPPLDDADIVSRALWLTIDETAGTWTTAFAFDDLGEPTFFDFGGDADGLANGNLLLSPGHAWKGPGQPMTGGQILEVDPSDGTVVWHLQIPDGWNGVDRVARIPGLYPEDAP